MFKCCVQFLIVALLVISCATKSKILKEIDKESPHHGHLFKLDDTVIEVAEVPTKRMKFYFYTMDAQSNLVPLSIKNIELKNGIIDPSSTKQNFGIQFIERQTYIEGILEKFRLDEKDDHEVIVDVKINGKRRNIHIPIHNE